MTLRTRLFGLVGATVAITVGLVTWTVSAGARRAFSELDAQRTAALVAQFRGEFTREGEQVVERLERLAASDAVVQAAVDLARSREGYREHVDEAKSLAAVQALDFLDVIADDGTIVSSAQWPARYGYRHPWALAAKGPNDGGAFLQAIELPQQLALGLVAVRDVSSGGRRLHLAGGRRLDEQFLRTLRLPAGMRALLYLNLERDVSRRLLIDPTGQSASFEQLEPLIARVRQTGKEATEVVHGPDGRETLSGIPLAGRDGPILGVLLAGSSGREEAALLARIRWSGVLFAAGGIVAGLAISYIVSSRVTRPVEQLAAAAREVAGGNWNVRVDDVAASGEIQELAKAFGSMTRELADQRERLVQAERVAAWRELARRLAHELKNPLFPLRITLDNLRRAKPLPAGEFDEVFEESLTTLATGLHNLNQVVGRFSDFARMPAPEFSDVPLNEIVEQAVQLFRAQAEAPDRAPIEVAVDLDPAAGTIRADAEQLRRAVQNLLLNAIDAMPTGGRLSVRTRRENAVVRLDVSDTGEGLTDEERQRLFTPYYTTKQHGTGLGLAIVQSVVSDHAGRIRVESEPGKGTTFRIELPI